MPGATSRCGFRSRRRHVGGGDKDGLYWQYRGTAGRLCAKEQLRGEPVGPHRRQLCSGRSFWQKGGTNMYRKVLVAVSLCALWGVIGCAGHPRAGAGGSEKNNVVYSCACGPQCRCGTVSTTPGRCACGAALKPGHVLKVEGAEAITCQCGKDCTCLLDSEDPTKCGCGKSVKRIDLSGSEIYFCNCMGSCMCNYLSDKPGKCKCGMDLKRAE